MKDQWMLYTKKADFYGIGNKLNIDPLLVKLMRNRDHVEIEDMRDYLFGTLENLHRPMLMKGMKGAISLLLDTIKKKERIRIVSDYDIDGICAGYTLWDGIKLAGGDVDLAIPDRITDGYGINESIITKAHKDGIKLIITCDNGIAAMDAISLAKSYGMLVIVTDHHGIPFTKEEERIAYHLPCADVIINPKQADCHYPFKELCGAAIAWKVVTALFESLGYPTERKDKYLEFAGIATIGDVVDLVGENRIIAKHALEKMNHTNNIGLKTLFEVCGIEGRVLSYQIGFQVGPCLNASGRLDTALKAVSLLQSTTKEQAMPFALELKSLNDQRKNMTEEQVIEAKKQAEEYDSDHVLVIYLPECHESIAGIVAGRVREAFYKPTLIFTNSEQGIKGSGRSIEAYDMFEKLSEAKHLFTKFGGHKMAAGFSSTLEQLDEIRRFLNAHDNLSTQDLIHKIWIDAALPFSYISKEFLNNLTLLEPFGKGNEKPVFAQKVRLLRYRIMGKNRNVVRMTLCTEQYEIMDGICFELGDDWESYLDEHFGKEQREKAFFGRESNIRLSILFYPEWNDYSNSCQLRIQKYQSIG